MSAEADNVARGNRGRDIGGDATDPDDAAEGLRQKRRDGLLTSRPFLLTLVCAFAYFLYLGTLQPELPRYVVDVLHGNGAEVGISVGALAVTACALRSTAGRLSHQRGTRFVIVIGIAVATVAVLLYNVAFTVPELIACRLLTGVGEAGAYVGLARLAYDLAPEARKAESTSYFTVSLFGAMAIGPIIGEAVRHSLGYHAVWFIAAGFASLALVACIWLKNPEPQEGDGHAESARPARRKWYRDLLQRDAVGPATILMLAMSGYAAFATFVPLYASHLHLSSAGPVLAENALIILVVRLFGARLPDTLGAFASAAASLAFQLAGWALVAMFPTPLGLYGGVAVVSLGVSLLYPALFTFAVRRAPQAERGNAVATLTMAFDIANGVGGVLLGGAVTVTGGLRAAFVVASALNGMGLLLLVSRSHWMRDLPRAVPETVRERLQETLEET